MVRTVQPHPTKDGARTKPVRPFRRKLPNRRQTVHHRLVRRQYKDFTRRPPGCYHDPLEARERFWKDDSRQWRRGARVFGHGYLIQQRIVYCHHYHEGLPLGGHCQVNAGHL